jgi:hypothetical protein
MSKNHFKNFEELHHTHKITHKVLSLTVFSIIAILAVYGLSRVRATQHLYAPVPNASKGICYKVGENFNDPNNHVSCKTYEKACQTRLGTVVECNTGRMID